MSKESRNPLESISTREIISNRTMDAKRELVFKAFANPKHLVRWSVPKGFTNTFHEFDFRPSGIWKFIMHGPDGIDFHDKSVSVEILEPEHIIFNHLSGSRFKMTISIVDEGGETMVSWRMTIESIAECDRVRNFVTMVKEENFDRLEEALTKMA
jgi:uncharacterized protein YndB with AHSA1/START domain